MVTDSLKLLDCWSGHFRGSSEVERFAEFIGAFLLSGILPLRSLQLFVFFAIVLAFPSSFLHTKVTGLNQTKLSPQFEFWCFQYLPESFSAICAIVAPFFQKTNRKMELIKTVFNQLTLQVHHKHLKGI